MPFIKALDYFKSYFLTFLDFIINFKPLLSFMDSITFIMLMPYPFNPYLAFPYLNSYPYLAFPCLNPYPYLAFPYPYSWMDLVVFIISSIIKIIISLFNYFILIIIITKVYYEPYEEHSHQ